LKVVVVGGGWAGLAAAVELARHGVPATVLEAARQLGGRARAVRFGSYHVDNGQHILLGAFHSVLALLNTIGVSEPSVFRRHPLLLTLVGRRHRRLEIKADHLPSPLHLAVGLLRMRGLSLHSRFAALRLLRTVHRKGFTLGADVSVAQFLETHRQPPEAVWTLWRPVCLAALNAPPAAASTRLFLSVLRDGFFSRRHNSDMLLPILDLSACLPQPATEYIEGRGGGVRLGARVQGLRVADGAVTGVMLRNEMVAADHVILAMPPDAAAALLRGHEALAPLARSIGQLRANPICTVYLRYPESVGLDRDFIGLLESTAHWLFDRGRLTGDPGLLAAVISGPGPHMRLTNAELIDQIVRELAEIFPAWPRPLDTKLVRERHATLAPHPNVDKLRPAHATPVRGLWLAGDYTAAAYPSNLESAVRSGLVCARWVLRHTAGDLQPHL